VSGSRSCAVSESCPCLCAVALFARDSLRDRMPHTKDAKSAKNFCVRLRGLRACPRRGRMIPQIESRAAAPHSKTHSEPASPLDCAAAAAPRIFSACGSESLVVPLPAVLPSRTRVGCVARPQTSTRFFAPDGLC